MKANSQKQRCLALRNCMKLNANKSIHCTDHEMVCDRNFFGCFIPPVEAPTVRVMTSQQVMTSQRKGLI